MGIDSNKVRMTGENSILRLSETPEGSLTAEISHWRVDLSPLGRGHVLFAKHALGNSAPVIYADNVALARWLQEGIQASLRDTYSGDIPITEAKFSQSGDALTAWTERIESDDEVILLTWYDFSAPILIASKPYENPEQPQGVYSVLVPAARAQMTVNGQALPGHAFPTEIAGQPASSCCLALSETWTIPPDHEWATDAL